LRSFRRKLLDPCKRWLFSVELKTAVLEQEAARVLPAGNSYEWTAMSCQEKLVGNSAYWIFAIGVLLVFCVLAAQYESWLLALAVVLAVPLALLGTAGTLAALGTANNLYRSKRQRAAFARHRGVLRDARLDLRGRAVHPVFLRAAAAACRTSRNAYASRIEGVVNGKSAEDHRSRR
jgi:hypothetical protein